LLDPEKITGIIQGPVNLISFLNHILHVRVGHRTEKLSGRNALGQIYLTGEQIFKVLIPEITTQPGHSYSPEN
jgi:hypothetical protein